AEDGIRDFHVTGVQTCALPIVRVGGDTVGEMAAMDGAPRSATVTACGTITALVLQPAALRTLLMRRPEIGIALTGIVADRLRWANRRRLDFRGYPVKVRLDRKSTRLNSSHVKISYAVFCLK